MIDENQISHIVYEIVQKYTVVIQVGSCDELFCDLSHYRDNHGFMEICKQIKYALWSGTIDRNEIFERTKCHCSIGISHSLSMCRIATKKYLFSLFSYLRAKPNGLVYISYDEIPVILHSSPITIIPGVGRSLEQQLASMDVSTCGELVSLEEVSVQ